MSATMLAMTEQAAIEAAMGSLKAHGFTVNDLRVKLLEIEDKDTHTAEEIIEASVQLLRSTGHNACADSIQKLEWEP